MTVKAATAPRCMGLPTTHHDIPNRMANTRQRDIYEHLRTFPWDVSCLTYLRCRHEIFPDVFSGKSTTTKLVEYLVELRFLANALKGWSEVSLGRSPHHLAPLDKRFITYSIANAYHELPEVFKELMMVKDRTYSSSVKKYCDEVYQSLQEIYNSSDVKALCESVKHCPPPMDY